MSSILIPNIDVSCRCCCYSTICPSITNFQNRSLSVDLGTGWSFIEKSCVSGCTNALEGVVYSLNPEIILSPFVDKCAHAIYDIEYCGGATLDILFYINSVDGKYTLSIQFTNNFSGNATLIMYKESSSCNDSFPKTLDYFSNVQNDDCELLTKPSTISVS